LPGLPFLRQEYPGAGQTTVFLERNLLFLRYLAINFPGNLLFLFFCLTPGAFNSLRKISV
jgi:hypothetical protein